MNPYEAQIVDIVSKIINDPSKVHLLFSRDLEDAPVYKQIKNLNKKVEGRKNSEIYQRIKVGDSILLSDVKGILHCKVTYINRYHDVKHYLETEGLKTALGELKPEMTIEKCIDLYHTYVPESEIESLNKIYGHGFLGIGIEFIKQYKIYHQDLDIKWFVAISNGSKIAEGRLKKTWVAKLKQYDMIVFKKKDPNETNSDEKKIHSMLTPISVKTIVTGIKSYPSFVDLFTEVGLNKVLPGVESNEKGVEIYRQWYSEEQEKKLGVVGIFVNVLVSSL
jgi:ASC-1-like (ASCH) protein